MEPIKVELFKTQKFSSIREMLELAQKEAGNQDAFIYYEGKTLKSATFDEFSKTTEYLGTALNDMGFGNSHIANIGENSYKWICIYLSVLKSAGVYVPVDKELPIADVINIVNDSESEILFYASKFEKTLMENRESFRLPAHWRRI